MLSRICFGCYSIGLSGYLRGIFIKTWFSRLGSGFELSDRLSEALKMFWEVFPLKNLNFDGNCN